ncbi:hypothetical protein LEP1GSC061_1266 [Leptospira wolffii serovar Khorat str. Khorat-H2]|nr:hypothetical protein LEP1GSC061_1266 [Leptospira wolffii serovar Khorat str. Khorat-H2]
MGSVRVSLFIFFIFLSLANCSSEGGGLSPIVALLGGGGTNPGNPGSSGAPSWVKATDAAYADKVQLEWEPIAGASYRIFRRLSGQADFQQIGTNDNSNFTDATSESGKSYQYSIQSVLDDGISSLSSYDTGWRASSSGCAAKLNPSGIVSSMIARFKGAFNSNLSSVAAFGDFLYVGNGSKINLLNRNRDLVGVWNGIASLSIVVDGAGSAYALNSSSQIYKLRSDCEATLIATLPADSVPTDLAIDSTGNLYVSESNFSTGTDRIFKLSSSGTLLKTWDLPGNQQPKAIYIPPGDTSILIADSSNFDLVQYDINGDQLDFVISKNIQIGTIVDIAMSGVQILVVTHSNTFGADYGPNVTRFHSGITQGAAIFQFNPDGQTTNSHRVSGIALDPNTLGILVTDSSNGTVYSCPAPLFLSCGEVAKSSSPIRMVRDGGGNLYVLHSNSISKHNPNGAHLASVALPNFSGTTISGKDMEIDKDTLYVSATSASGVAVLSKIKTDLASSQTGAFQSDVGLGTTNIAVSSGTVYNDVLGYGDTDTFIYIGSILPGGGVENYPDFTFRKYFLLDTLELETDGAGNLFSFSEGFNEDSSSFTAVAKFDLQTTSWLPLADGPNLPHLQIGTDLAGNLYSVDINAGNTGMDLVQRDSGFAEKKRLSLGAGLNSGTLCIGNSDQEIFFANSDGLHRFSFPVALF